MDQLDKFNLNVLAITAWLVLCVVIGISLAGGCAPEAPQHSYVKDLTQCDAACTERARANFEMFFRWCVQNPTAFKNIVLDRKYPRCTAVDCAGRVFDGYCDICGKEKK